MGVIVNTIAVIIASLIGIVLNKGIAENISKAIMKGIGIIVVVMGIEGALSGENTIVTVISITIGVIIGEWIDIDQVFHSNVQKVEKKMVKQDSGYSLSEGFITATMIFCIGSMAIIGSLESGLTGDHTTLYTKSLLDTITAIILASSLGIGVIFSAVSVFIYQGSITLLASYLQPYLPQMVITEMIAAGSILLIGLGLNLLELTELKILNYTPAILLPILIMLFL